MRRMAGRSVASAALAVAAVVALAGCVALMASPPAALQQLMPALDLSGYATTQMLPQFSVNGAMDVPDHPPGMKYVKTDPMGSFEVTSPEGDSLGTVQVLACALLTAG